MISVLQLAIIGPLKNLDLNAIIQNNGNFLGISSIVVWTATMPPTTFIKEDQLHTMTDRVLTLKPREGNRIALHLMIVRHQGEAIVVDLELHVVEGISEHPLHPPGQALTWTNVSTLDREPDPSLSQTNMTAKRTLKLTLSSLNLSHRTTAGISLTVQLI